MESRKDIRHILSFKAARQSDCDWKYNAEIWNGKLKEFNFGDGIRIDSLDFAKKLYTALGELIKFLDK